MMRPGTASGTTAPKLCIGCNLDPGGSIYKMCPEHGYLMHPDIQEAAERKLAEVEQDKHAARKACPMARGLLDYFPAALMEVARLSAIANEQHNPGEEIHWARRKSSDHADCILRHMIDRGTLDDDGVSHTVKIAWRALAMLQEELEVDGAAPGRASQF